MASAALLGAVSVSQAQYSFPPGPTAPIQALLNGPLLPVGTTITLQAGTYVGTIDFNGQPVTIQGAGSTTTIIDGSLAPSRVITFQNGEGPTSVLRDLQVRRGGDGGVKITGFAAPVLQNCIVRDNVSPKGAGILIETTPVTASVPTLERCRFYSNTATGFGGGASVSGLFASDIPASFVTCEFSGNHANVGGGIHADFFARPEFTRCVFKDNVATATGGGAYWSDCAYPTFSDCAIVANTAADGGGLAFERAGVSLVRHCTITDNQALGAGAMHGRGGGLFASGEGPSCDADDSEFENCLFFENVADVGGAAYLGSVSLRMTFVTSTRNFASVGVGGIMAEDIPGVPGGCAFTEVRNSILWGNFGLATGSTDTWSKELWAPSCSAVVHTCDIEGALSSANPPSAWIATNLQEHDPRFVQGYACTEAPVNLVFLSQPPVQPQPWSRCVNAAPGQAPTSVVAGRTTRTDGIADTGRPDLGFHYPSTCP